MKICHRCNSSNVESSIFCNDCNENLNNKEVLDYKKTIEKQKLLKEMQQKREEIIKKTITVMLAVAFIALWILNFINGTLSIALFSITVCFITIGYFTINYPALIFKLRHLCDIENTEDVKVTLFYRVESYIFGGIGLILALLLLIKAILKA